MLDQHAVAELVAERVVDGLEVVEVEEQHCNVRAATAGRLGRSQHFVEASEQLPAVRQARQRVVLGEVLQLLRALLDAVLEVRLVRLDGAFGLGEFPRHVVERLREFLDLARTAGVYARGEVTGGELARAFGEPPNGARDRPRGHEQRDEREQHGLDRGAAYRGLRALDRDLRAGRGSLEVPPRGRLDVFADLARRAGRPGSRTRPGASTTESLSASACRRQRIAAARSSICIDEPVSTGRDRELRAMRRERAPQQGFAAFRPVGEPPAPREFARDVVPCGFERAGQFRNRRTGDQAVADDDAGAAGALDAAVECGERLLERGDRVATLVLHGQEPEALRLVRGDLLQQILDGLRVVARGQVHRLRGCPGKSLGGRQRRGAVVAGVGAKKREHCPVEGGETVAEVAHACATGARTRAASGRGRRWPCVSRAAPRRSQARRRRSRTRNRARATRRSAARSSGFATAPAQTWSANTRPLVPGHPPRRPIVPLRSVRL